jgi:hypothetical protein
MGRRWHKTAAEYTFFYGKGTEKHEFGICLLCIRESYQQLRGLSLLVIRCRNTKRSLESYYCSERSCSNRR